jgi:hypothetical protein
MSMDWEECRSKFIVKKVKPDKDMIESLLRSSDNKIETEQMLKMTEVTAASKLSLAYDSLREVLEALALKKGYKVYNHECYTAFLKEMLNESVKGDEFDDIRKIRNAVNYYGKNINQADADKNMKR